MNSVVNSLITVVSLIHSVPFSTTFVKYKVTYSSFEPTLNYRFSKSFVPFILRGEMGGILPPNGQVYCGTLCPKQSACFCIKHRGLALILCSWKQPSIHWEYFLELHLKSDVAIPLLPVLSYNGPQVPSIYFSLTFLHKTSFLGLSLFWPLSSHTASFILWSFCTEDFYKKEGTGKDTQLALFCPFAFGEGSYYQL